MGNYWIVENDGNRFVLNRPNGSWMVLEWEEMKAVADFMNMRRWKCELTDQGITEFSYGITLFDTRANVTKKARLFNTIPTHVIENNHAGTLPTTFSGISADRDNVILSAFKRSEDGKGIILRAYEADGKETDVTFSGGLLPKPLQAHFTPYSVDTYFLADGGEKWESVMMTEMK